MARRYYDDMAADDFFDGGGGDGDDDDNNGVYLDLSYMFDEEEQVVEEEDEAEAEAGREEEEMVMMPRPVFRPPPPPLPVARVFGIDETEKEMARLIKESQGTASSSGGGGGAEGEESEKEWSGEDVDGLVCPICMEPWASSGDHQPSCLTCGHLFGMSCIKKWLGQRRNSGKCPQCNKKCMLKDVRRIYGSRVVVIDEESQKRIRVLEAKCDSLENKEEEWRRKEVEWRLKLLVLQKKDIELCLKVQQLQEREKALLHALTESRNQSLILDDASDGFQQQSARGLEVGYTQSPVIAYTFVSQQECPVDGARYFDVDDSGQILIIARRPTRIGEYHVLTKMSLISPHEQDNVLLPSYIKAVRDLHLCSVSRLALMASKTKLSVMSMESNNIVLNYDLAAAAWSCSWDRNSSYHVYAGLQNGMLLVFDLRQTGKPVESRKGLTCNPVHSIYSLSEDSPGNIGARKVLTASSAGLCEWTIGEGVEEPSLVNETANQGVCISLAHCPRSNNIVATFRPKVEMPDDNCISQVSQAPSPSMGHHVQGLRVFMQRVNDSYQKFGSMPAYVPSIRLPKSTIIGMGDGTPVFACGDEATSNLYLQVLPSLKFVQSLKSYDPIRDVKYTTSTKPRLLCCLSQDRMQFFSQKLL